MSFAAQLSTITGDKRGKPCFKSTMCQARESKLPQETCHWCKRGRTSNRYYYISKLVPAL